MYDVVVVGAGPAGSAAAKKCAESGFKTLILEKRQLPRHKICSGMIMGPLAHSLIKDLFGEIPETLLTDPRHLSGYAFHVPGVGRERLDHFTLLTWRRDLDYWMNQKAQASGVEIWQNVRVLDIKQHGDVYSVEIEKNKAREEIETRFLVGADGATSVVRASLFPDLKVRFAQIYQEHYRGSLDLERDYIHWFYPVEISPASFTAHQKDDLIILDVTGRAGQMKPLMDWAKKYLTENHALSISQEPVWKGGCLEPALFHELTSHTFRPAKGNVLLAGDAAGLMIPVSGEGIGVAMKSGLLAARSIAEAEAQGGQAEQTYLEEINDTISAFEELYPWFKKMIEEAERGGHALPQMIRDGYQSTLRMF